MDFPYKKSMSAARTRGAVLSAGLLMVLSAGCTHAGTADAALARAKDAYSRFLAENPPQNATAQYRMYYAQAESARENGSYSSAVDMAGLAEREAEEGLKKRGLIAQDLKKKLNWLEYELEKILYPSGDLLDACFGALDAYKAKNYEKAQALYDEGKKRMELEKATAFQNTIVLQVPPSLQKTFKGRVRVYSYIGEDRQLHDIKGEIDGGVQVTFLEKRYMKKNYAFYRIRTKDGTLEGWIYPHFVKP